MTVQSDDRVTGIPVPAAADQAARAPDVDALFTDLGATYSEGLTRDVDTTYTNTTGRPLLFYPPTVTAPPVLTRWWVEIRKDAQSEWLPVVRDGITGGAAGSNLVAFVPVGWQYRWRCNEAAPNVQSTAKEVVL